ncbi:MAG: branched-chain amino acid ABC transporter permease [Janthinobacterium lividum]
MKLSRHLAWQVPIAVLIVAAPFFMSDYRLFQLVMVMVYAMALLGLNILTGYNGQISLGHGAFYAVGAYVAAILMDQHNFPYWSTLPIAGVVCFVVGFLFGLPALKLERMYLALATFALAIALPQLLKYKYLEPFTNGVQGISVIKPDAPFGLPLSSDQWMYYFSLFVAVILFILAANLLRGRIGRAMVAIRDKPVAAEAMGVNIALYKSLSFGVSALYTGIAGALGAIATQFVAPDSFSLFLSIALLVGMVIGGATSISGAIYGAIFVQFVPNVAEQISKAAPWAIYGVFLIAFMFILPEGIAGGIDKLRMRYRRHERKQGMALATAESERVLGNPLASEAGKDNRQETI